MNTPREHHIIYELNINNRSSLKFERVFTDNLDEVISKAYQISALTERAVTIKFEENGSIFTMPVSYKEFKGIPTGVYYQDKQLILQEDYLIDRNKKYFTQSEAIELASSYSGIHLPSEAEHRALCVPLITSWGNYRDIILLGKTMYTGFDILTKVWKYKKGGYMNTDGQIYSSHHGFSWSSSVSGTYGLYLSFYASHLSPSDTAYRAYGLQVRCLQD